MRSPRHRVGSRAGDLTGDISGPDAARMILRPAVALILLLAAPYLYAQEWSQEPTAFRKVPFGANEAAVRMQLGTKECFPGNEAGERLCSGDGSQTIGDVATGETYLLRRDAFTAAHIKFDSDDYEYLRDVFTQRYGDPHDRATATVKTLTGVTLQNETLKWRGQNAVVILSHYSDKVTTGTAVVATREWYDSFSGAEQEKKRKAARSF